MPMGYERKRRRAGQRRDYNDYDVKTVVAKAFGMEDGLLRDVDGVFGYEREFSQEA